MGGGWAASKAAIARDKVLNSSAGQQEIAALVARGDVAALTGLMEQGRFSPQGCDAVGTPYLVWAALQGQVSVVKCLISTGCSPDAANPVDQETALMVAAQAGNAAVVRQLLKKKASAGLRCVCHTSRVAEERSAVVPGMSALDMAVAAGHELVASVLASHSGVDVNDVRGSFEGRAPLHWACELGRLEVAKVLLANGALLSVADANGRTPLHVAVAAGNVELCALLVESAATGAAVRELLASRDKHGQSVLELAVVSNHAPVLQRCLEWSKGGTRADAAPLFESALQAAATAGNAAAVAKLVSEAKGAVNAQDRDGTTALARAATRGHYETCRILVQNGADVNLADRKRNSPLHHTAFHGFTKVANLLLDAGADPNTVNVFGQTPLDRAAQGRGGDSIRRLLEEFGGTFLQGEAKGSKKAEKKKKQDKADKGSNTVGAGASSGVVADKGGVKPAEKAAKAAASSAASAAPVAEDEVPRGRCRFFLSAKGKCPYGAKCRFTHEAPKGGVAKAETAASAPSVTAPAAAGGGATGASVDDEGGAGAGAGAGGSGGGDKKPRSCPLWNRKGRCRFGDRCKFLHDPNVVPKKKKNQAAAVAAPAPVFPAAAPSAASAAAAVTLTPLAAPPASSQQQPGLARLTAYVPLEDAAQPLLVSPMGASANGLRCGQCGGPLALGGYCAYCSGASLGSGDLFSSLSTSPSVGSLRMSLTAAPFVPTNSLAAAAPKASVVRRDGKAPSLFGAFDTSLFAPPSLSTEPDAEDEDDPHGGSILSFKMLDD